MRPQVCAQFNEQHHCFSIDAVDWQLMLTPLTGATAPIASLQRSAARD
jgi:hypothetical protein